MSKQSNPDSSEQLPSLKHRLVTNLAGEVEVLIPSGWPEGTGLVMKFGEVTPIPLLRIHSRCTYGDVFGSLHCDCGEQLAVSAQRLRQEGGLLFYLEQEGRGAGLRPKAAAYEATEHSQVDTFTVYEQLGLSADPRTYDHVADALQALSIASVRLLTNNPAKAVALREAGIAVEIVPLVVAVDPLAEAYLASKRLRGHAL